MLPDFLKEVLKAVGKVPFSGSTVTKMAQLCVMWLACDSFWLTVCDLMWFQMRQCCTCNKVDAKAFVKNIFKSAVKKNLQKTSVHGEVNELSNKPRSTIQSVQSCQQKVKNTMASSLNLTEMVTPGVMFKSIVQRAEMALAATLLPSGRVRSVMARTTLGLARAGNFTSSDT